jgi:uncharacterized protein
MDLPELSGANDQIIRIPQEIDVPITGRVRAILDTTAMQRLKGISQLGLVSLVYPGAVHSRFEHSVGVFRLACLAMRQLQHSEPVVAASLSSEEVQTFLLACLLHDVGHWPYCHPIEDMQLEEVPSHESAARHWIIDSPLSAVIRNHWQVEPEEVADFLAVRSAARPRQLLQNLLNGPVDIDKIDYLQRDSLHAGVPYGRNFDAARLMSSFRFGDSGLMTITAKGKTAAEMMVFSRYVMFSEVYWHHAVRSATAMLQRLVFRLRHRLSVANWLEMTDADFQSELAACASDDASALDLWKALFGRKREIYKRCSQFSFFTDPEVHSRLAHRPYPELVQCADRLAALLSKRCQIEFGPDELLIDAPPQKLEIQFRLDIQSADRLLPLAEVSPVVRTLATDQFDNFVKMVRIFVSPRIRQRLEIPPVELTELVMECSE